MELSKNKEESHKDKKNDRCGRQLFEVKPKFSVVLKE
jgi:hypothetical protein